MKIQTSHLKTRILPAMLRISMQSGLLLFTLLCAAIINVQTVDASTITVMNTTDSGAGSLRQALADSNFGDTINFDASVTGTITLTSGELLVNDSITISGPGANVLAVDGNAASRVFHIASGSTVTISGLTITNGLVSGVNFGGGIDNDHATLTVDNCTVSGNSAPRGGGIFNDQGTLTVNKSTLSSNAAANGGSGFGGGIENRDGTLTVNSTTLSGNSADSTAGGIYNNGGFSRATLSVSNSTLSGNSAAITTGGIYNDDFQGSATLTIGNTILKAGSSGENIAGGTVISFGYNLSSDDASAYLNQTGDQNNIDPMLGPLQDNGGPTFTHVPSNNSPAIDAGDPTLPSDQRGPGFLRVVNNRIDIGAVEVQATPAPVPVAPTALDATDKTASSFTANWSSVSSATGYRLDVSTSSSFVSYVAGYENLDVGNVTSQSVTGLAASTFYYYRLRAHNDTGTSPNSNIVTVRTKNH